MTVAACPPLLESVCESDFVDFRALLVLVGGRRDYDVVGLIACDVFFDIEKLIFTSMCVVPSSNLRMKTS